MANLARHRERFGRRGLVAHAELMISYGHVVSYTYIIIYIYDYAYTLQNTYMHIYNIYIICIFTIYIIYIICIIYIYIYTI